MVAQQIALERPSVVRKMLLVGTAPEGGKDIMHMEKPELKKITDDPNLSGLERLVRLFFTPSESSQRAGKAFAERLAKRAQDREPVAGAEWRRSLRFALGNTRTEVASANFGELLRRANARLVSGTGSSEMTAFAPNPKFSKHSFGCHFVEVTWQPETARLRVSRVVTVMDAGRILNPLAGRNQIEGAVGGLATPQFPD
jgi:hypothetical protein